MRLKGLQTKNWIILLLTLLPCWWGERILLLYQEQVDLEAYYLLGFISDAITIAAASFVFSAVFPTRSSWFSVFSFTVVVFSSLLLLAQREYISVFGWSMHLEDYDQLIKPEFFTGSVLPVLSKPMFLISMGFGSLPLFVFVPRIFPLRFRLLQFGTGIALLALALTLPTHPPFPAWRYQNLLSYNLLHFFSTKHSSHKSQNPACRNKDAVQRNLLSRTDLSGKPFIADGDRAENVLLIILESLAGYYIKEPGTGTTLGNMPNLSKLAYDNHYYRNYLSLNRQTNRGEYALYCSDYPNLANKKAKMNSIISLKKKGVIKCLPEKLKGAGYHTAYLQAAPLRYMKKDHFFKELGVEQVLGEKWFKNPKHYSNWGVSDGDFFEQSIRLIKDLQQQKKPWFLGLLTVGTHHPIKLPKEFRGINGRCSLADSFSYLDQVLDKFLVKLEELGIRQNTLILITGDESVKRETKWKTTENSEAAKEFIRSFLHQNWTPMIILHPNRSSMVNDQLFSHVDFSLSVLDYLGLHTEIDKEIGRSLFRKYSRPRSIVFANLYSRRTAMFDLDNTLHVCSYNYDACSAYQYPKHNFLHDDPTFVSVNPLKVAQMKCFSDLNDWTSGK